MNESYKELMVKKESGLKEKLLRVVSLIPTIFLGFLTLLTGDMSILIIAIGLGVLCYFVFQWTDIEYEYLYLDKEINIDKIMAKTRRKRVATISTEKMEILAPAKSHQLDSYRSRKVKEADYSAGNDMPEQKLYALYSEGSQKYLLSLDEDFVKTIKGIAPRKVFMD